MAKISDIQRERELIGLFLLSRLPINTAIDLNFNAEECTDNNNKEILEIILEEARYNTDFIPSSHFIVDKLELTNEKDIKKLQLKLNRYKNMVARDLINEEQYIDTTQRNIIKLRDYYTKRNVINVLKNGLEKIELPAREFISLFQKGLNEIEINDGNIIEISIHSGFKQLKEEMEYQVANNIEFGIKFGYRDFDKLVDDNIAEGTYSLILGRPSNYKTGLALNLGQNAAMSNIPTAIISCEMKVSDIYRRILSRVTKIPMNILKKPKELTKEQWKLLEDAINEVEKWPLYVIDGSKLNISQYDSLVSYLKSKYGVKLVLQDYLQLIRNIKGNIPQEEWEFGSISEDLRMIAKNHNIAFMVLTQANRGPESRDDKRPTLRDIRNSGKLEQDAHNIFYVYRDEFYYGSKSEVPNHLEIGAIKMREGELKKVLLSFDGARATLGNTDPIVLVDKPSDYIGSANLFG